MPGKQKLSLTVTRYEKQRTANGNKLKVCAQDIKIGFKTTQWRDWKLLHGKSFIYLQKQ